jgi:glutamate synthase domain-containing protein 3
MNVKVSYKNGRPYLEGPAGQKLIRGEDDVVEIIGLCYEHDTDRVMLYEENLTEHFFDLSSREAGEILQKFRNYFVKVAAVMPPEKSGRGKFGEMVAEENQGGYFNVFENRDEAESWLTKD